MIKAYEARKKVMEQFEQNPSENLIKFFEWVEQQITINKFDGWFGGVTEHDEINLTYDEKEYLRRLGYEITNRDDNNMPVFNYYVRW